MSKDCSQTLKNNMFYGLKLDKEQEAFRDAIWDDNTLIVFCNAKSGSGKTLIATATAQLLYELKDTYDGIVFIASPTQEGRVGFLPGTIEEKTDPYFEPFYQARLKLDLDIQKSIRQFSPINMKNGAYVDVCTHLYLRGVNFENKIIIIDEAQNLYADELKKTLTRAHDNCKIIVIGHTGQNDLYHNPENSGFARYLDHFKDQPYCKVCKLTRNYRGKISTHADALEY